MAKLDNDWGKKALLTAGIALVLLVLIVFAVLAFSLSDLSFQKSVAVIPIKGEISNAQGLSNYSALELVEKLEEAKNDPTIGVIFLDIESPGGSVVATKQIVYKIREVMQTKPVVSYIGEVGASGAYYTASASDYILADPDSITGSIGVISIIPSLQKFLDDLGVKVEVIKAGEFKAAGNLFEDMSEEERQIVEGIINETFAGFKKDVLNFRAEKLSPTTFDQIADGRILSGRQALNYNLIDELASREDAIKKAASLAGISGEPSLVYYSKPAPSLFDFFLQSGKAFAQGFKQELSSGITQSVNVKT